MSIAKEEQYNQEQTAYLNRSEAGVQALRSLLYLRRDQINRTWPEQVGDTLIQHQGRALEVAWLIRLIDEGPRHKQPVGEPHGN
jgi:hypothetical protein